MKTTIRIAIIASTLWMVCACSLSSGNAPESTLSNEPSSAASALSPSATAKGKPNIILVLADDLNSDEMQYMPKMKALIADQGESFANYFVPESLCCPSRASTLRGQYPHNTKILSNDPPVGGWQKFYSLGEEKSTAAVWLQQAGYRTMLAGKYLNGYPNKNDRAYIPPGWDEWYVSEKGDPYSEFNYTLNENGKPVAYGNAPADYGTDVYVAKTVDFLQRNSKNEQPVFIYLAPYAPHAPYTPAPRHANLFPEAKAPRTPNYDETDVSDKPGYIRNLKNISQKNIQAIDEAYRKRLQSLQAVDEGIEKIVNTLEAEGKLDNTYIFFTSDNGYHLGNHRQILGKIAPYEEELRVTMAVRGPGIPAGKTLDHLVGNVDLAPTWAELAGAEAPAFCDGRSLVPLLAENPTPQNKWRQAFPLEWGTDPLAELGATQTASADVVTELLEPLDQDELDATALPSAQKATLRIPNFRGIRLATWSYVEYQTGEVELYDISKDPYQLNNLASTADPKLLAQLAARVKELAECKAATCRIAEDKFFSMPN